MCDDIVSRCNGPTRWRNERLCVHPGQFVSTSIACSVWFEWVARVLIATLSLLTLPEGLLFAPRSQVDDHPSAQGLEGHRSKPCHQADHKAVLNMSGIAPQLRPPSDSSLHYFAPSMLLQASNQSIHSEFSGIRAPLQMACL